jgi:uncharacterized protein with beta-barrel porin domain
MLGNFACGGAYFDDAAIWTRGGRAMQYLDAETFGRTGACEGGQFVAKVEEGIGTPISKLRETRQPAYHDKQVKTKLSVSFGLLLAICIGWSAAAHAQPLTITIDAPGVQSATVPNSVVETFDKLQPSSRPQSNIPFDASGTYNSATVTRADVFGGAGGTGNYLTTGSPTTLMLNAPQRYFGMWWSAGDSNDTLQFYSGTRLLQTFTTADVINYINNLSAAQRAAYFGNPNSNGNGNGRGNGRGNGGGNSNSGEPYAFINFFADPSMPSVTFDRIVFSGIGFESDNHTINGSYTVIVGMEVDPEPIDPVPGDVIEVGNGGGITSNTPAEIAGGSELIVDPGSTVTDTAPIVIDQGGTVDGGGTVVAPVVENEGLLVSDGMTIEGNFKQDTSGTLDISAPGNALKVSGNAMLAGELIIAVPPTTGEVIEVLSATNGVTGNFATASDPLNSKGLAIAVINASDGVEAVFLRPANGRVFEFNDALPLDAGNLLVSALAPNARQAVLPLQVGLSDLQLMRTLIRSCQSHIDEICVINYAEAVDEGGEKFSHAGIAFNVNHQWIDHFQAGVSAGYDYSWGGAAITANTGWGAVHAAYVAGRFRADGAIYAGGTSFTQSRLGLEGNASSGAASYLFGTSIEAAYDFSLGNVTVSPFASLQYGLAGHGGYDESGSLAPLAIENASQYSLSSDLGVQAGWNLLRLRLGWEHEYAYSAIPTKVGLIDVPLSMTTVYSPRLGRDSLVVEAGVDAPIARSISGSLTYRGQFGGNLAVNGIFGELRCSF